MGLEISQQTPTTRASETSTQPEPKSEPKSASVSSPSSAQPQANSDALALIQAQAKALIPTPDTNTQLANQTKNLRETPPDPGVVKKDCDCSQKQQNLTSDALKKAIESGKEQQANLQKQATQPQETKTPQSIKSQEASSKNSASGASQSAASQSSPTKQGLVRSQEPQSQAQNQNRVPQQAQTNHQPRGVSSHNETGARFFSANSTSRNSPPTAPPKTVPPSSQEAAPQSPKMVRDKPQTQPPAQQQAQPQSAKEAAFTRMKALLAQNPTSKSNHSPPLPQTPKTLPPQTKNATTLPIPKPSVPSSAKSEIATMVFSNTPKPMVAVITAKPQAIAEITATKNEAPVSGVKNFAAAPTNKTSQLVQTKIQDLGKSIQNAAVKISGFVSSAAHKLSGLVSTAAARIQTTMASVVLKVVTALHVAKDVVVARLQYIVKGLVWIAGGMQKISSLAVKAADTISNWFGKMLKGLNPTSTKEAANALAGQYGGLWAKLWRKIRRRKKTSIINDDFELEEDLLVDPSMPVPDLSRQATAKKKDRLWQQPLGKDLNPQHVYLSVQEN